MQKIKNNPCQKLTPKMNNKNLLQPPINVDKKHLVFKLDPVFIFK